MEARDARIRLESTLRRAGLSEVPRQVIVCVAVACALLVLFAFVRFWPSPAAAEFSTGAGGEVAPVSTDPVSGGSGVVPGAETSGGAIAVDVEGAVCKPGVYELASDARVEDAVEAAGGFGRGASRTSVNLAQKLADGTQVYVATKKEMRTASGGSANPSAGSGSGAAAPGTVASGGKVNINTASAEGLQALAGIGPALSQRIVDHRESKGPFSSVEGLKEVSGIGDAKFAAIEDSICV